MWLRRWSRLIVLSLLAGAIAAVWRRRWAFLDASISWTMWLGFWTCVSGALFGLTAVCIALRLRILPRPLST
ncbi:MAG: hypothetical protein WBV82_00635 [Myxococcaceae bacterium]